MKKSIKIRYAVAALLLVAFAVFTVLVMTVDVRPVGVDGTEVGFSHLNQWVTERFGGYREWLYTLTEWLGNLVLCVAAGFAVFGGLQLIRRRSFIKVDWDIYVLAGLYIIVIALYVFFNLFAVNYRPVVLEEGIEASYPSSHTLLAVTVMASAFLQFRARVPQKKIRIALEIACAVLLVATVAGRLVSGVHLFTDVLGGVLLGAPLVVLYAATVDAIPKQEKKKEAKEEIEP